ncbi:MAG: ABC transporter ATP-binding protein, partial [Nitratireductor sp.]
MTTPATKPDRSADAEIKPVLNVAGLKARLFLKSGVLPAVDDVSFSVMPGETLCIVGESGCGKSMTALSIMRLLPRPVGRITGGSITIDGVGDLTGLSEHAMRRVRGNDVSMIFQEPMTSLNPVFRVGYQISEAIRVHHDVSAAEARERAIDMLEQVRIPLPAERYRNFPHQLSGGMRQRVMIAMALINEPKLLIADEPTTALDVTIQAQILKLIAELQTKRDIGVIFISHDLAVVADIADQIIVMQQGKVVEGGDSQHIFHNAEHPYTKKLLAAIPADSKAPMEGKPEPIIQVRNLSTWFEQGKHKEPVKAVNDVSFDINRGEVLGLVGESGSGKS